MLTLPTFNHNTTHNTVSPCHFCRIRAYKKHRTKKLNSNCRCCDQVKAHTHLCECIRVEVIATIVKSHVYGVVWRGVILCVTSLAIYRKCWGAFFLPLPCYVCMWTKTDTLIIMHRLNSCPRLFFFFALAVSLFLSNFFVYYFNWI